MIYVLLRYLLQIVVRLTCTMIFFWDVFSYQNWESFIVESAFYVFFYVQEKLLAIRDFSSSSSTFFDTHENVHYALCCTQSKSIYSLIKKNISQQKKLFNGNTWFHRFFHFVITQTVSIWLFFTSKAKQQKTTSSSSKILYHRNFSFSSIATMSMTNLSSMKIVRLWQKKIIMATSVESLIAIFIFISFEAFPSIPFHLTTY